MNKKLLFFTTIIIIPLVGCNSTPTEDPIPKIDSLKSALEYISVGKNYELEYVGDRFISHSHIFTKTSIGTVSDIQPTYDLVYYQDGENGVYSIGHNGDKFVGSEYYKESKDVWSNAFDKTMLGVGKSFIDSIGNDVTDIEVKDKEYKIGFIQTIGYEPSEYVDVQSLKLSYKFENNVPSVIFNLTLRKTPIIYEAKNFGTAKNEVVDNYLAKGGKVYTPNDTLALIRDYITSCNFEQSIYQYGETPETTGYVGNNYFNKYYYVTNYNGTTYASGYISLNFDGSEDDPEPRHGVYSVGVDVKTLETQIVPRALYDKPDMAEFMHYPTNLKLMKHLEFARDWDNNVILNNEYVPEGDEAYVISDFNIVADFANNFDLDSAFENSTPVALGIDFIPKSLINPGDIVVFIYKFRIGMNEFVYPLPCFNFGETNIALLDLILSIYNKDYIAEHPQQEDLK